MRHTQSLIIAAALAIGMAEAQNLYKQQEVDDELIVEASSQDPLNKMITMVAFNAFDYYKNNWFNHQEGLDQGYEIEKYFKQNNENLQVAISQMGKDLEKNVKGHSLWDFYNPNTGDDEEEEEAEQEEVEVEVVEPQTINENETYWGEIKKRNRERRSARRASETDTNSEIGLVDFSDEEWSDEEKKIDDKNINETNNLWNGSAIAKGACQLCKLQVSWWNKFARDEMFQMVIERLSDDLCYVGRFSLYLNSCSGFSKHIIPGLFANLSEVVLTPDYFCPFMNICKPEQSYQVLNAFDYIEQILSDKPDYLKGDNFIDNIYEKELHDVSNRKTISIVQFTDIHLDLEYQVGSNIFCNNMLCCRKVDGMPDKPEHQAGPYGTLA